MRKSLFFMLAAIAVMSVSCGTARKTAEAEKAKIAEWKSEGYSLTGSMSTFTLQQALSSHNIKILSDNQRYIPVMGTSEGSRVTELSVSSWVAQNDAAIRYAQAAGSIVSGGIARKFSNLSEQGSKLVGAYTQKVSEYIIPLMKESFSLCRLNGSYYEVISYFIIDEETAVTARERALRESIKETDLEFELASEIDNWVKEFVKVD